MEKFIEGFIKDSNRNRFLLVNGEIGVGKTLITKNVAKKLVKVHGHKANFPLILTSTIHSLDQIYPYSGLRYIFRQLFRFI